MHTHTQYQILNNQNLGINNFFILKEVNSILTFETEDLPYLHVLIKLFEIFAVEQDYYICSRNLFSKNEILMKF